MTDSQSRSILTVEGKAAWIEAIDYLKTAEARKPLAWSDGLAASAFDHCEDIGGRGVASHNGSDGSSPFDRIARYGTASGMEGENISFGSSTAKAIIMDLFVDDGVRDRGHRNSLMQKAFKLTGISFCKHDSQYKHMTDVLYAGSFALNTKGEEKIARLAAMRGGSGEVVKGKEEGNKPGVERRRRPRKGRG